MRGTSSSDEQNNNDHPAPDTIPVVELDEEDSRDTSTCVLIRNVGVAVPSDFDATTRMLEQRYEDGTKELAGSSTKHQFVEVDRLEVCLLSSNNDLCRADKDGQPVETAGCTPTQLRRFSDYALSNDNEKHASISNQQGDKSKIRRVVPTCILSNDFKTLDTGPCAPSQNFDGKLEKQQPMTVVAENATEAIATQASDRLPQKKEMEAYVGAQAADSLHHRVKIGSVINVIGEPEKVTENAEDVKHFDSDSTASGTKVLSQSEGGGAEAVALSYSRQQEDKSGVDTQLVEKLVNDREHVVKVSDGSSGGGLLSPIEILSEEAEKTEELTDRMSPPVTATNSLDDMLTPVVEAKAVLLPGSRSTDLDVDLADQFDAVALEGASESSSDRDTQEDNREEEDDDDEDESEESFHTNEVSLKEEDIEELIDQLLVVESEAANIQESLEEESLLRVKEEVTAELAETLSGDQLESAVEEEMTTYVEQCEDMAEEVEERSALIQEKLEDAGVSLTHLFKWIEKQTPEGCTTEAWKRRTLWVGHQPTEEVVTVLTSASEELNIKRPTRSHHGKILDEGASGFLERKLATEGEGVAVEGTSKCESSEDDGWSKVDEFLDNDESAAPGQLMGTKRWAAVYLASTPEQAAQLGLKLPGIDSVEEIGDLETEKRSLFKAALKNERERGLTEGQKKSIKKVREEDDVRKIRRRQRRSRQKSLQSKHVNTALVSLDHVKKELPPPSSMGDICSTAKEADNVAVIESSMLISEKASIPSAAPSNTKMSGKSLPKWKSQDVPEVIDLLSDDDSDPCDIHSSGKQQAPPPTEAAGIECSPGEDHNVGVAVKTEAREIKTLAEGLSDDAGNGVVHETAATVADVSIVEWNDDSSEQLSILPEQSKKRTFEELSAGKADEEPDLKKSRSVYIIDEKGQVNEEKVSSLECSKTELKQLVPLDMSNKSYVVRRTVVIDSDGEREVEEALTGPAPSSEPPNGLVTNALKLVVVNVKTESVGAEEVAVSSRDEVVTYQEMDRVELLQSNGRKRKARIESDIRVKCTACGLVMKVSEVIRHPNPKLAVAVCKTCTRHYLSGPIRKDEDGSDSECSWCAEGGQVVCCTRCDKVFCQDCITRNFGSKELLRVVTDDYWLCFFCNDRPLTHLTQELIKAEVEFERLSTTGRQVMYGESDEPTKHEQSFVKHLKRGRHRKNIRRMLSDDELEEKQKELLAREKERQERLERWQSISPAPPHQLLASRGISQPESENVHAEYDNLPEVTIVGLPINALRDPDEEPIFIAPNLARVLKPHQIEGVRFMWQNCMESVKKVESDPGGVGCILAHSMGLGKTLQVITFLHTVLTSELLWLKTALIVVPVNVLHNWRKEFEMWQENLSNPVPVHILDDSIRENSRRAQLLSSWHKGGGVLLIGYSAFRNLSNGKHVKDKVTRDSLCESLQNPGPDILVCDEAHMIKNAKADITQVLKQVRSKRRVALTGSPLQNNLMEYYCMVDFVREGFLGTPSTFKNRFQNPIENGQHCDSTARDVRVMKVQAHILNKHLRGFVQRMDSSVLKDELPPKCVYVISVRLSKLQRRLYEHYLQVHGIMQDDDEALEVKAHPRLLFNAYNSLLKGGVLIEGESYTLQFAGHLDSHCEDALIKVWNHPDLLLLAQEEKIRGEEKIRRQQEDLLDEFGMESDDEKLSELDTGGASTSVGTEGKLKVGVGNRFLKKKGSMDPDELENPLWWKDIMEGSTREDVNLSGKMVLLLELLSMSAARGDKTLVFSQNLGTLDIIERFMETRLFLPSEGSYWEHEKHWYRLDGRTPAAARMEMCQKFNNPDNTDVKCILISTRAGCLGINLPSANRVIIVDGSWNPTHDLQALFRAWRLGQKKPVFAYRLLACGTMEEKIYNRQVAKEGVAARVLDKNYPERIFNGDDLDYLYRLEPDDEDYLSRESDGLLMALDKTSEHGSTSASSALVLMGSASKKKLSSFQLPDDAPPVDDVMGKLLLDHRPRWIVRYHEHDPLLEHQDKEDLSAEERLSAWQTLELGVPSIPVVNSIQTLALPYLSTTHLEEPTIIAGAPSASARASCSSKDHAGLLAELKVEVREQILCPSCNQHVSWNDISTGHKQFVRG